ncbi:MAG: helix-turn-helix domain-containing protein [bacterium]|nr:helix-turn-helix domain-containing protein [bacterium]
MVKALLPETKVEGWLDTNEAAALLGVHPQTVRVLVRKGKLEATHLNSSRLVFEEAKVEKFKGGYKPRKPERRVLR